LTSGDDAGTERRKKMARAESLCASECAEEEKNWGCRYERAAYERRILSGKRIKGKSGDEKTLFC